MNKQRITVVMLALLLLLGGGAFWATRPPAEIEAESFDTAAARLRVDLSERKLYIEENGSVVRTFSVAVGKSQHPTPRGTFAVRRVIWNPRWVPPNSEWARGKQPREPGDPRNPMGRVKAFFREPTYYLHGTDDESSIGRAASHGCVRMRNDDIIELSRWLVEHGGAPIEPGMIQRILNRARQEHEARLSQPVPLRIQA
jgi:lipoprotein-anchoring transpeptidase ErfK/SrfK